MKRNNLARFLFLLLIMAWAGTEMTPLFDTPGKLIEGFNFTSKEKDEAFDKLYATAKASHEEDNSNEFGDLYDGCGGVRLGSYELFSEYEIRGTSSRQPACVTSTPETG